MRQSRVAVIFSSAAFVGCITIASALGVAQQVTTSKPAAESLADRFAGPPSGPPPREVADKAKAADDIKTANEAKARADAQRRASAARLKKEEADMLARAKAESEQRRIAIEQQRNEDDAPAVVAVPESPASVPSPARVAGSVPENTTTADPTEQIRKAAVEAEVQRRVQEAERTAERQAELDAVSEKIRRAQMLKAGGKDAAEPKPLAAAAETAATAGTIEVPSSVTVDATPLTAPQSVDSATARIAAQPMPVDARSSAIATASDTVSVQASPSARIALLGSTETRASLLLVMQPGNAGIRRHNKSADPILCIGDICYISRGPAEDAVAVPSRRAFGVINTLGPRAGACSNQLTCVFRNIELGASAALIQPVDLRLIHHDRRQPSAVRADISCTLRRDQLSCGTETRGPDYRMWAVPESVSAQAGPRALVAALDAGLPAQPAQAR